MQQKQDIYNAEILLMPHVVHFRQKIDICL